MTPEQAAKLDQTHELVTRIDERVQHLHEADREKEQRLRELERKGIIAAAGGGAGGIGGVGAMLYAIWEFVKGGGS